MSAEQDVNHCRHCKCLIKSDHNFCGNCGKPNINQPLIQIRSTANYDPLSPTNKPWKIDSKSINRKSFVSTTHDFQLSIQKNRPRWNAVMRISDKVLVNNKKVKEYPENRKKPYNGDPYADFIKRGSDFNATTPFTSTSDDTIYTGFNPTQYLLPITHHDKSHLTETEDQYGIFPSSGSVGSINSIQQANKVTDVQDDVDKNRNDTNCIKAVDIPELVDVRQHVDPVELDALDKEARNEGRAIESDAANDSKESSCMSTSAAVRMYSVSNSLGRLLCCHACDWTDLDSIDTSSFYTMQHLRRVLVFLAQRVKCSRLVEGAGSPFAQYSVVDLRHSTIPSRGENAAVITQASHERAVRPGHPVLRDFDVGLTLSVGQNSCECPAVTRIQSRCRVGLFFDDTVVKVCAKIPIVRKESGVVQPYNDTLAGSDVGESVDSDDGREYVITQVWLSLGIVECGEDISPAEEDCDEIEGAPADHWGGDLRTSCGSDSHARDEIESVTVTLYPCYPTLGSLAHAKVMVFTAAAMCDIMGDRYSALKEGWAGADARTILKVFARDMSSLLYFSEKEGDGASGGSVEVIGVRAHVFGVEDLLQGR